MFPVLRDDHPRMAALLVDRGRWRGEVWICEGADRNGDQIRLVIDTVVNSRAAGWAEMEGDAIAGVSDAGVRRGFAMHRDRIGREAGLCAEGAAGPPLTGEAVADRDADGFALRLQTKPAATARRPSRFRFHADSRVVSPGVESDRRHRMTTHRLAVEPMPITISRRRTCSGRHLRRGPPHRSRGRPGW